MDADKLAEIILDNDPQRHKKYLQKLVKNAEKNYKCNRGPRPSGATLMYAPGVGIYGYVEPTDGSPSCKDVGCMIDNGHCVRNIHAEVDALLRCARLGEQTDGATMYSINKPCYNCTLACIKAGISTIYYAYAVYDEQRTRDALKAAGVKCERIDIDG